MTRTEQRVFLPGPIPYIWSGVEFTGFETCGINARWHNTDTALKVETFAQVSAKRRATRYDQESGAGTLIFTFEYEEWVY